MIIDAHNHPEWHGHNLSRTLENMARFNIDVTWLLTWECPKHEWASRHCYSPRYNEDAGPIPLAALVSYAERAPGKFVLGYAPDPRRPEALDNLEAAIELYDVRICGELKVRMMYDNPDVLRLFRFCAEKKLPVVFHLDYDRRTGELNNRPNYWYGGTIESVERALHACPDTIFLGHAPGFWSNISGDGKHLSESYPDGKVLPGGKVVEMLRRYPNLYCDLSAGSGYRAMARDTEFTRDFLLEFQDRVLYARDCFDNQHQELLNGMDLPPEVLKKIYADNALRLIS